MREIFDVVILGMGPAGLAAAARMEDSDINFAMVDAGKSVYDRDRHSPSDATSGHGGAGLFSDGKFSFFPSASDLWTLPHQSNLKAAYTWTCQILSNAGLDTPPFPTHPNAYSGAPESDQWVLKAYPSDYLSLPARLQLVDEMVARVKGKIFDESHVDDISYDACCDIFTLNTRHLPSKTMYSLLARRLIVTTGRFGPLSNGLMNLTQHHSFQRLEVGFRIEQSSERAFFRNMKQLDPKLRFHEADGSVEWRTFCVCREGEAVLTETEGLWTVSGRSDCPSTGRSNSGFNTRITSGSLASQALTPVIKSMSRSKSYFEVPMVSLLDEDPAVTAELDQVYSPDLRRIMTSGLYRLATAFPDLGKDETAKLIGPTLEGVGWYPSVDGGLRLLDVPAWVAGDACGLFRGIVAAMISGHYAAAAVLNELQLF